MIGLGRLCSLPLIPALSTRRTRRRQIDKNGRFFRWKFGAGYAWRGFWRTHCGWRYFGRMAE